MGTVWRPPVYWPSKVGRSPAHACVTVVTGDYSMLCSLTPPPAEGVGDRFSFRHFYLNSAVCVQPQLHPRQVPDSGAIAF